MECRTRPPRGLTRLGTLLLVGAIACATGSSTASPERGAWRAKVDRALLGHEADERVGFLV